MPGSSLELKRVWIFQVPVEGPQLRTGRDAVDLISAASEHSATLIVIPIQRPGDDFFDLRTRMAGEISQKLSTYRLRAAILGDIRQRIVQSKSLAAFVAESNRGTDLWFVETLEQLEERL